MTFTVLDSLNTALHQAMQEDERVLLLGQDILDPYGGAFKVTRGLSSAFPDRVLTTPISEAGITGIAAGMALRGLRPVVEIMFGDFLTLAADQLINHAAKFRWMYGGQHEVESQTRLPFVIRTPMGGRRGYGPTHSQTLEKLFLGVPGLRVLAPCSLGDPGELLRQTILYGEDPTLFVENKLLYLLPVLGENDLPDFDLRTSPSGDTGAAPTYSLTVRGAPQPVLTLCAYGYMAELARQAALRLAYEHEIFVELLVPTQLSPFQIGPILYSVQQHGRVLAVEEGSLSMGWGAEILARLAQHLGARLQAARRVAALDFPVPASAALEALVLPDVERIVQAARSML